MVLGCVACFKPFKFVVSCCCCFGLCLAVLVFYVAFCVIIKWDCFKMFQIASVVFVLFVIYSCSTVFFKTYWGCFMFSVACQLAYNCSETRLLKKMWLKDFCLFSLFLVVFSMFHFVLDCSRLFQVVQFSCFSWFWRMFKTVLGCYTLIFGCFECFRFFRAVLNCLGHLGSTKPFRLCSAALVRCVVQFVMVVLRCRRSVKVVANLSYVVSRWLCLFWVVWSCLRCCSLF